MPFRVDVVGRTIAFIGKTAIIARKAMTYAASPRVAASARYPSSIPTPAKIWTRPDGQTRIKDPAALIINDTLSLFELFAAYSIVRGAAAPRERTHSRASTMCPERHLSAKLLVTGVACISITMAGLVRPVMAQTIDWPTFGGNAQRNNYNAAETILSPSTVPGLKELWRRALGIDYAYQPSLVRQVTTPTGTFDLLFVTLPQGVVTALNAANGKVIWSTRIPPTQLSCPGTTAQKGIGEPATIDIANSLAFVVDAGGLLHALSLSTGAEMAGYPVEVIDGPNLAAPTWVHFASPTLVGTNLYIGTAAMGNCESPSVPYHGQVIEFDTTTISVVQRFFPLGNGAVVGGGFWGTGGLAAEADGSYLWGATANALPPPQNTGNAEKIVQLDMSLNQIAAAGPILPPSGDLDFGSTPLLFQPTGCPPMLAAMNKSGVLLTYNRTDLAAGPVQLLNISNGNGSSKFIGMPSFDPVTNAVYVSNPKDSANSVFLHGLIALQANASCQLSLLWQQTLGLNGNKSPSVTPFIANGVVYYAEGNASEMTAFNAASGAALWSSGTLPGFTKAPPLVVNGQVFVGAGQFMYAYGL
jgi:outer membrane protein assembly factor BamB